MPYGLSMDSLNKLSQQMAKELKMTQTTMDIVFNRIIKQEVKRIARNERVKI